MRSSIMNKSQRKLAPGAAVLLLAGLTAGCSSTAARFAGADSIFTATTNRQQIIPPANQPYPGDQTAQAGAAPVYNGPVQTAGIANSPVGRSALAPVAAAQTASVQPQPVHVTPTLAETATRAAPALADAATRAEPAVRTAAEDVKGWSRSGGSEITAREGETLYNLSRRYGVPVDVIAKANGLSQSTGLRAGDKVIIPTYNAHASAPDSNQGVATAKPTSGTKYVLTTGKPPLPSEAPTEKKEAKAAKPVDQEAKAAKPVDQKVVAGGTYKVQDGDTLSRISRKTGVSVAALKEANGLKDGALHVGKALTIPAAGAAAQV